MYGTLIEQTSICYCTLLLYGAFGPAIVIGAVFITDSYEGGNEGAEGAVGCAIFVGGCGVFATITCGFAS